MQEHFRRSKIFFLCLQTAELQI